MNLKALIMLPILAVFLFLPNNAFSKLGVGVGTGKIEVQDKLKPGIIYDLPPITIVNTGDEASDYVVTVEYRENVEELRPDKEWFSFSPQEFYLEPGEAQIVNVKLTLPLDARPGDYFTFLSGSPTKKAEGGQTTIGVAAAAKLYFTIDPANKLQGAYYRGLSLWQDNQPYSSIALGAIAFVFLIRILRRFVNINVSVRGKSKDDEK